MARRPFLTEPVEMGYDPEDLRSATTLGAVPPTLQQAVLAQQAVANGLAPIPQPPLSARAAQIAAQSSRRAAQSSRRAAQPKRQTARSQQQPSAPRSTIAASSGIRLTPSAPVRQLAAGETYQTTEGSITPGYESRQATPYNPADFGLSAGMGMVPTVADPQVNFDNGTLASLTQALAAAPFLRELFGNDAAVREALPPGMAGELPPGMAGELPPGMAGELPPGNGTLPRGSRVIPMGMANPITGETFVGPAYGNWTSRPLDIGSSVVGELPVGAAGALPSSASAGSRVISMGMADPITGETFVGPAYGNWTSRPLSIGGSVVGELPPGTAGALPPSPSSGSRVIPMGTDRVNPSGRFELGAAPGVRPYDPVTTTSPYVNADALAAQARSGDVIARNRLIGAPGGGAILRHPSLLQSLSRAISPGKLNGMALGSLVTGIIADQVNPQTLAPGFYVLEDGTQVMVDETGQMTPVS